ncbi:cell division protein FtsZ [Halobaculum sp. D14]|uniref:cell division protein FtsZ n=1 Tax=unclassified Halobaculum TaxID=2640896 RepID=UPI003EBBB976
MPYLFVGAGQAGCAIVDSVFDHERVAQLATPVVFNSTIRDLQNLSNIEREAWYGVSASEGLVPGTTPGFEEEVTGGFGRDPQKADDAMQGTTDRVVEAYQERFGEGTPPFAFLFLGLGGGTGCGIAPHLADAIKAYGGPSTDVIAVAVMPNTTGQVSDDGEASATRQAANAVYGLNRLEEHVDGVVLVDNQRLAYEDAAEGRFNEYNDYVGSAIVDLISGPILERIDPGRYDDLDAPVVDLQDVVTSLTLNDGGVGYASLGRSVTMTRSLLGYVAPFVGRENVDGAALSRLAVSKRSVADLTPADAQKAIGQVRAPAPYITDDDHRIQVSVIRSLLDSYCSEVNIGMTLTERNLASFTTLLTFAREDISRIAELEELAEEHAAGVPA